ncbi:MAG: helix-turn-helix domain-containing protein [Tissierellaceae bacterium]|nr:helix-turn-helix domain-containing protein [Tissierellaceae bacterium]
MQNGDMIVDPKEIGSRIREEREKLGLSREKFSEIVGLSSYFIGQIERGDRNMSLETLIKITSSLNISIDYILKGYTLYMENILVKEAIDENYKEEIDEEVKEILNLLSSTSKEGIGLIKDMIKLLLPSINK